MHSNIDGSGLPIARLPRLHEKFVAAWKNDMGRHFY